MAFRAVSFEEQSQNIKAGKCDQNSSKNIGLSVSSNGSLKLNYLGK